MPPYAAEPTRPYRKRLPYGDSISRSETLLAAPLEQLQQVLYFTATEGAYDVVAYLLAMGVPPPVCDLLDGDLDGGSLIYLTLKAGHLGVANLLYAHGAPIYSYDWDDGYSYDWDDETQGRSLCRLMEEEVAPAALDLSIRRWLNSLPERAPQVASHRFLPAHGTTNVIPQFAPRLRASVLPSYLPVRPPPPPGAPWALRCLDALDDFQQGVRGLRWAWAKHSASHHWRTLRRWAKARAIAFYWLGRALERTCAPGGARRAADLRAFRRDFTWIVPSRCRLIDMGYPDHAAEQMVDLPVYCLLARRRAVFTLTPQQTEQLRTGRKRLFENLK